MRWITELHKRHLNKPIWIVGSDQTLEDYPDDFLKGKIAITLHLAGLKFPDATYRYANELDRVKYLLSRQPDFLKKENIFAFPFFNKDGPQTEAFVGDSKPYFLRLTPYPPTRRRGYVDWDFTWKKVIEARNAKSVKFGGHGTCMHACFYVAVMMGGNPINIIGCGLGTIGTKEHYGDVNQIDRIMRPGIKSFSDLGRSEPMREQTYALIGACRKEGIVVNWLRTYAQASRYS